MLSQFSADFSSTLALLARLLRMPRRRPPYLLLISFFLIATQIKADALWIVDGELTAQAKALIRTVSDAKSFALEPTDYELGDLNGPFASEAARENANAGLTKAAARLISDLHFGRVDPQAAGFHFPATQASFDVDAAVEQLSTTAGFAATLRSEQPRARPYWLLLDALARYRELASAPNITLLPALPHSKLKDGDVYEGAPAVRRLLQSLGDLDEDNTNADSLRLDAALTAALKSFQARNGLTPDGILGTRTYAVLITPLSRRVRQIELAVERWRWINRLERPDIVVNVPQFMLYALPRPTDAGAAVLEMPVVVGQSDPRHQTPIFAAQLTRVIFRPYWDIPDSIMRKELLPLIRKDLRYLEKHDMEIVSGARDDSPVLPVTQDTIDDLAAGKVRLRQRPGARNALGSVKFVLPNTFNVYLHDTPEQALFAKPRRDFSHGCVRVSNPAALAEYVLKNAAVPWDINAIQNAMCGTQTIRVDLQQPLRVMFFYSTAAATQSRGVLFADDLYGQDAKLEGLLQARIHQSETSSR